MKCSLWFRAASLGYSQNDPLGLRGPEGFVQDEVFMAKGALGWKWGGWRCLRCVPIPSSGGVWSVCITILCHSGWKRSTRISSKTCIFSFQVPQKFHRSSAEKEKLRLQRVRHYFPDTQTSPEQPESLSFSPSPAGTNLLPFFLTLRSVEEPLMQQLKCLALSKAEWSWWVHLGLFGNRFERFKPQKCWFCFY